MFASLLLAYFFPLGSIFITLSIQSIVKLCRNKELPSKEDEIQT